MSSSTNSQILLKQRPDGEPQESDFAQVETDIPQPGDGEVLNRTIYLSLSGGREVWNRNELSLAIRQFKILGRVGASTMSISRIMVSSSLMPEAAALSATCWGRLAPTMAEVTR